LRSKRATFFASAFAAFLAFLLSSVVALAQETPPAEPEPEPDPKLPKLKDMPIPSSEELLTGRPVDWLVIRNESVLVVEPVQPRPDTLAKMQAKIEEARKWPRPAKPEEMPAFLRKRDSLVYLQVALPGESEEPEWQISIRIVTQVIHHEDLMLKRTDLLLAEGKFREAYELLFVLERNAPGWPGTVERRHRLLLLEGLAAAKEERAEAGMAYLEDLHNRDPKFDGLKAAFGTVVDKLVADSLQTEDFLKARHFLERLRKRDPQHEAFARGREELLRRSQATLALARDASNARRFDEAALLAHKAARTWPATPGMAEGVRQHAGRFQSLNVGVIRWAGEPTNYPFEADAEWRLQRLAEAALFEWDGFDENARYRSPFLDGWEPVDLGRRTILSLRPTRTTWESTPVLTSAGLMGALAPRLNPLHPEFDERLAAAVRSMSGRTPFELDITFARAPMQLEALLQSPLRRTNRVGGVAPQQNVPIENAGAVDGPIDKEAEAAVAEDGKKPIETRSSPASNLLSPDALAPRFLVAARTQDQIAYRRVQPEADTLPRFHLAEIVERKYPTRDKAVQALLRGDISMLPDVQSWDVDRLREDARFFVVKQALPKTHIIQFHPQTKALRTRELRRALAYAIDREALLRDVVLREAPAERGRLVTAPWPMRSRAYDRGVAQIGHDPAVATALALAAKKVLGGKLPELRMVCPPDPIDEAAATQIISQWKARGINVTLITQPDVDGSPIKWDLCYRTLRMSEPAVELWPLLTLEPQARVASLHFLPQWLARDLIAIDETSDWQTATALLRTLHERLLAETELIPLWEVDDYLVFRKNVRGFRPEPVTPYQDVESWTVDPWFNLETP
jgi:tetratricopeptide (TPR) repeat protein